MKALMVHFGIKTLYMVYFKKKIGAAGVVGSTCALGQDQQMPRRSHGAAPSRPRRLRDGAPPRSLAPQEVAQTLEIFKIQLGDKSLLPSYTSP